MPAIRLTAVACLLLCCLPLAAAERAVRVRGLDGQRDLLIDRQRTLQLIGPTRLAVRARTKSGTLSKLLTLVRARLAPALPQLGSGAYRLSERVRAGSGDCRDQAFLLRLLAQEFEMDVRVRYGELYQGDVYLGGHAWANTPFRRRLVLLDPALSPDVLVPDEIAIDQALPDGTIRRARGWQVADWLYVED